MSLSPPNPTSPTSQGTRGLRFLLALSLVTGLGLAVFAGLHVLTRQPLLVLLVGTEGGNLDLPQRGALDTLVQDHLECLGGLPVANAQAVPLPPALATFPGRTLLLQPVAFRQENRLHLSFRYIWLAELQREPGRSWHETPIQSGSPATTLLQALRALPLNLTRQGTESLVPSQDGLFWSLLQGMAWHRDDHRLEQAQVLGQQVTAGEPACATAWILRGDILYRRLLIDPRSHSGSQIEAESHFAKALSLVLHHPRGSFLLAEMRIDAGDQRTALSHLQAAVRQHPRVTALYAGIAYAARTAGLLGLARRALERRDRFCPPAFSQYTNENTFLYLGEQQRFKESLLEIEGNPRNVVIRFYKGYIALAEGDRQGAQAHFLRAAATGERLGQFHQLAQVYAEIAASEDAKALQILGELERSRAGLRVPDGEFTFKMGEAYALLGQREEALNMLSRAFAQGFGCARWYAESPFLGDLRQLPRWKALLVHVQERQQLLEGHFKPSEFGL